MQIFADVFGLKTVRNSINGSASLGSAICVAVALGIYNNFNDAMANMVKVKDIFHPIVEHHNLYNKFNNNVYKNVTKHTDEILKKSYEVIG
jgi:sugar (pentulose or hexulose) kinase